MKDPLGTQIAIPLPIPLLLPIVVPVLGGIAGWYLGEWIWDHFFNTPTLPPNYPNPSNPPGDWTPRPDPRPGEQIWNDPDGNIWRWHPPDAGHDVGHWDIGTPDGDTYRWYPDKPMPDIKKKKSKSDK